MASTQTSLNNHFFGGIRRKDSMFTEDKITCSDCQNVELYFTELNSGVGIRTSKGNVAVDLNISTTVNNEEQLSPLPEGEEIIGIFETVQNNVTYHIVYTEDSSSGHLYRMDMLHNKLYEMPSRRPLVVTGKAHGENFQFGTIDAFVFSNGENLEYIYTNIDYTVPFVVAGAEPAEYATGMKMTLDTDSEGRIIGNDGSEVKGLGLVNLFKRLWVFNGTKLYYSTSPGIGVFRNGAGHETEVTRAGVWEAPKNITAIHEYLGSLAVFHNNSSCLITEDAETLFKASDESPGGCASYDALVFHGTDLFFYDDTKKGVFSFQQVINGDKTLGDNIAYDIQSELMEFDRSKLSDIRALSVITADRNEIWFLVPIESTYTVKEINEQTQEEIEITKPASIVLIYDYIRGEWVKRKCQHINCIGILGYNLYSAGTKLYQEYTTDDYDGDFIENFYQCTVMNLGTDNTLKITKFPPRLTIDASYQNKFFVKYVKNYNISKKPKIKPLASKSFGNIMTYNSGDKWSGTDSQQVAHDYGKIFKPGAISGIIKMPSATFKALEITFYTTDKNQEFTIKALEFSRLKVKQI
jgi:hypothetical protein